MKQQKIENESVGIWAQILDLSEGASEWMPLPIAIEFELMRASEESILMDFINSNAKPNDRLTLLERQNREES